MSYTVLTQTTTGRRYRRSDLEHEDDEERLLVKGNLRSLVFIVGGTICITFLLMISAMKLIVSVAPWETTEDAKVSFNEVRMRLNADEKLLTENQELVSEHQKQLGYQLDTVTTNLSALTTSVGEVTKSVAVLQQRVNDDEGWAPDLKPKRRQ